MPQFSPTKRTRQIGRVFSGLFAITIVAIFALPRFGGKASNAVQDYLLPISGHDVYVDRITFWAFVVLVTATFVIGGVYGLLFWSSRHR